MPRWLRRASVERIGSESDSNSMIGAHLCEKRVSIHRRKRCLVNPSLCYLDEPTSGLDLDHSPHDMTTPSRAWPSQGDCGHHYSPAFEPAPTTCFHKVVLLSEGCPIYYGLPRPPSNSKHARARRNMEQEKNNYEKNISQEIKSELYNFDAMTSSTLEENDIKENNGAQVGGINSKCLGTERDKERRFEAFNRLRIFQLLKCCYLLVASLWWAPPETHVADRGTWPLELALPTAFVLHTILDGGLNPNPATFQSSLY
ncbi:hypothetical protein Cgig2_029795 [Carnegiea gigantea]|uniref:Uncharacterized protein n=1 Tax=Carnegiea gigantea TaxID=171969 RepID=A0A9Q1KL80_9CARY|nr:hypothetical protein Cgig2_029795 [Carnegiea gigantea]